MSYFKKKGIKVGNALKSFYIKYSKVHATVKKQKQKPINCSLFFLCDVKVESKWNYSCKWFGKDVAQLDRKINLFQLF